MRCRCCCEEGRCREGHGDAQRRAEDAERQDAEVLQKLDSGTLLRFFADAP